MDWSRVSPGGATGSGQYDERVIPSHLRSHTFHNFRSSQTPPVLARSTPLQPVARRPETFTLPTRESTFLSHHTFLPSHHQVFSLPPPLPPPVLNAQIRLESAALESCSRSTSFNGPDSLNEPQVFYHKSASLNDSLKMLDFRELVETRKVTNEPHRLPATQCSATQCSAARTSATQPSAAQPSATQPSATHSSKKSTAAPLHERYSPPFLHQNRRSTIFEKGRLTHHYGGSTGASPDNLNDLPADASPSHKRSAPDQYARSSPPDKSFNRSSHYGSPPSLPPRAPIPLPCSGARNMSGMQTYPLAPQECSVNMRGSNEGARNANAHSSPFLPPSSDTPSPPPDAYSRQSNALSTVHYMPPPIPLGGTGQAVFRPAADAPPPNIDFVNEDSSPVPPFDEYLTVIEVSPPPSVHTRKDTRILAAELLNTKEEIVDASAELTTPPPAKSKRLRHRPIQLVKRAAHHRATATADGKILPGCLTAPSEIGAFPKQGHQRRKASNAKPPRSWIIELCAIKSRQLDLMQEESRVLQSEIIRYRDLLADSEEKIDSLEKSLDTFGELLIAWLSTLTKSDGLTILNSMMNLLSKQSCASCNIDPPSKESTSCERCSEPHRVLERLEKASAQLNRRSVSDDVLKGRERGLPRAESSSEESSGTSDEGEEEARKSTATKSLVPPLKLNVVGAGHWMGGEQTAGDTYYPD